MVDSALLKYYRSKAGYSQEQSGAMIGCTKNTYSEKENGKAKFDIIEARILCEAFNVRDPKDKCKIFLA